MSETQQGKNSIRSDLTDDDVNLYAQEEMEHKKMLEELQQKAKTIDLEMIVIKTMARNWKI